MILFNPVKCLHWAFLLFIACALTSFAQAQNTEQPEVAITQGILQGITLTSNNNRNFSGFLGIPFAQPPIGKLRFANPVAADGWNGTRDASVDGNVCPQNSGNVVNGDEDCLNLNVYTPQLLDNTSSSLLPVMVFIHGGAYVSGSAEYLLNNPQYILDKDVVLVVPNYRLGPLGFLGTGDEVASGNWALKDQILALKWVQTNIRYFGGDPDQVTIFGLSAGSASVHLLSLSNATNGLFHRYITQSGSAIAHWASQPRATSASRAFQMGECVNCLHNTSDSLIECLRTVNFSDIIAAQPCYHVWQQMPSIVWSATDEPDIEGAVLTDTPMNLFAAGKFRDLPWISGVVSDEGLILTGQFYNNEELLKDFFEKFDTLLPYFLSWDYLPDRGAAQVKAIKSYYFNNDFTGNSSELFKNLTMLISDGLFVYPAYSAVQKQFNITKSPEYFYTFNYRGTYSYSFYYSGSLDNIGVGHGDDLIYLFPHMELFPSEQGNMTETDLKMVDSMVQLWTSFAISGKPTVLALNDVATWEPYSEEDNYLRIGNEDDVELEVQYSFLKERMEFWASLDAAESTSAAEVPNQSILLFLFSLSCLQIISRLVTIKSIN